MRVVERRSVPLTGRGDCEYASPAHTADEARLLLRVLLGRDPGPRQTEWLVPIAGGSQRIELEEAPDA